MMKKSVMTWKHGVKYCSIWQLTTAELQYVTHWNPHTFIYCLTDNFPTSHYTHQLFSLYVCDEFHVW